jgi:hypothetical protein
VIYIKAPGAEPVDKLLKCWPDIIPLVDQVCQNLKINMVIDDPVYDFDCELYNPGNELSLLLRINCRDLEVKKIEAALNFGLAQITTLETTSILVSVAKISKRQTRVLMRKYLHCNFYPEASEFSEHLMSYLLTSLIKELSYAKLDHNSQAALREMISSGFQTALLKPCFRPLIIVDNIWRRVSGLDITAAYSQFMDAGLLHSFLNIYREILDTNANPTKQSIDEVANKLAEIAIKTTFREVTGSEMVPNTQTNIKLTRLKSEIEDIVRKKEERDD